METLILIAHVVLAVALIALVLLQQGKGAEAGAAFGSGASQTMFGSQGTGSFLGRVTGIVALGIFLTSFTLAVYAKQKAESISDQGVPSAMVIEQAEQQAPELKENNQPSTDVPKAD
jgi:preprotein translocase subunit SecG